MMTEFWALFDRSRASVRVSINQHWTLLPEPKIIPAVVVRDEMITPTGEVPA